MKIVDYSYYRFCFKADIIEPLDDNDIFIMRTPDGTFQMTKAEFYDIFSNVVESDSYQKRKIYYSKKPPKKALQFMTDNPLTANVVENDIIDDEIKTKIKEIGRLWRESKHNPVILTDVLVSWNETIDNWIKDCDMPLIVRKETKKKGQSLTHPCGREIIISDNSFAIWVFGRAMNNETFSISQLKKMLYNNEIPIVMMQTKEIKEKGKYTMPLGSYSLSGWKVCHIEPVGFNTNKPIEELNINQIENHFRKYANPNNMFLLPKDLGPLGEIKLFIDEQKSDK